MNSLETLNLNDKTVLLRLDLNVPLSDETTPTILDDYRLRAILPTINYLLNRQARIVIASHLGRPAGKPDKKLSLEPVYRHLAHILRKPVYFVADLPSPSLSKKIGTLKDQNIIGLENLRFHEGEEENSRVFARQLAACADLYINDAFADSHRTNASIVAVTEFLPSYPGLLLEKEFLVLTGLMKHPAQPFVGIIGGAKVEDKLPVIKNLLQRVDRLLVGGGVANTFLVAEGFDVKSSLVQKDLVDAARDLLKRGRQKIVLPSDFVWDDKQIVDIGPKTIELFRRHLHHAKTIFWAGPLGVAEKAASVQASREIAQTLAHSPATTVVGGGNTIEILDRFKLARNISFVSTGGGATLRLLSGEHLPGIAALEK